MIRRNDRGERRHSGDDVLNGYRGEVTGIDRRGNLSVRWESETADGPRVCSATLPPAYVGAGGVQLAYAMTTHKAEGQTVAQEWTRPDGSSHEGTVLVQAAGPISRACTWRCPDMSGRCVCSPAWTDVRQMGLTVMPMCGRPLFRVI